MGGGNLNIINQQGEPQKGGTKFLKFSRGKQNGWDTIFDLNLVGGRGGGNLGGNHVSAEMFLILRIDMHFQVFLMLFQLASK